MYKTLSYIIIVSRLAGIVSFICFLIALSRKTYDVFYFYSYRATMGFFALSFILWLAKLAVKDKE